MTDSDLLKFIKATPALQVFADAGHDDLLAQAIPTYAKITVPKPFTAADVLGGVTVSDLAKFATSPMFDSIRQDIRDQNVTGLLNEATIAAAAGLITQAELQAIEAVVTATQQVPDTSVTHQQVSRIMQPLRIAASADGVVRATPINWSAV